MIRALVVDDEAPARQRLRDLLENVADVTLVGECPDAPSALQELERQPVDLLFLDVQMPEMDGFEMLHHLAPEERPAVVFVTAFDEHAVAAFDARALDYLLKPFTERRFHEALARAREQLRAPSAAVSGLLSDLRETRGRPPRLAVREEGRTRFVDVDRIRWIEADGNYVRIHLGKEELRTRATLKSTLGRLASFGFIRVHQSYAVNTARIQELQPWTHGEFAVVLDDGTSLVSSRTYSGALRKMLA